MAVNVIDACLLAKMFLAGANNLESKKEWINELNVFPVPDGDTGTNMTMTIMAAAKEVAAIESPEIATICKAMSSGSLRGARGNSGVILSQLIRGFTKAVSDKTEITVEDVNAGFQKAVESAYKAVMKPKEGTILTVAKGMAEKAAELYEEGCEELEAYIGSILEHGDYVLSQTPEMLPVLKQAGVVDSGGQGLMEVLKGAYDAFCGKDVDYSVHTEAKTASISATASYEAQANLDIKFGYCTEFIILLSKQFTAKMEKDFKSFLESIGDSAVVVADDDIVKVHVHTNDPGLAIQKALTYGALSNMKIDNMRLEHQEKLFKMEGNKAEEIPNVKVSAVNPLEEAPAEEPEELPRKEVGFIAVSVGEGINEILKDLGVDYIIEGGQTMNPSTEDMMTAISKVNADTIFVLPNNKNIIMAANQARDLEEDKNIIVIPTKNVPQGIAAVINYMPDLSPEDNAEAMTAEMENVKTGQVTYAVRDTVIDDKEIHQGDYMGIGDHGIVSVGTGMEAVTLDMIRTIVEEADGEAELISIYYGSDIEEETAEALLKKVEEKFPGCDIELQNGGQPIYYYIVSVE